MICCLKIPPWLKSKCKRIDKEGKGKVMLVCMCFTNYPYQDPNFKVTQRNLRLFFKGEYEGNKKIQYMKVLNLIREFELQRLKESDTIIKEYSNKLLGITSHIKLLGKEFSNSKLVEKIMVMVLEIYEASIALLENTKYLSTITLIEVMHALQAQEQRRLMSEDRAVEGVLLYIGENVLIFKNNKRNKCNNT